MPTFFYSTQTICWINLTPQVAKLLLGRDNYAGKLLKIPFVELMINEDYPHLNEGKDNYELFRLSQIFSSGFGKFGGGATVQ